jgi:ribosomal protein L17
MNITKASLTAGYIGSEGFSAKRNTSISNIGESFLENKKIEKTEEQIQADEIRKQIEDLHDSSKSSVIDAKLKAGSELSNGELEFLKEKYPELYQKAMEIKAERELYRNSLESCQTKDDVQMMHLQKMNSLADAANKIKNNPNISDGKKKELCEQIQRRSMAAQNEFMKYTATKKYKNLPTRAEIIEGKKKATREIKSSSLPKELYASIKKADESVLLSAYSGSKNEKLNQKA